TGDVPDGAGPTMTFALRRPLGVTGNDPVMLTGALRARTPPPTFWNAVTDKVIGTFTVAVAPAATLTTPVVSVVVPLTSVSGPVPFRTYPSAEKLMLFTEMPVVTFTVPTPVAPKIAPTPAELVQVAPDQFGLVVSQVKLLDPLSHVMSPAVAEPA